MLLLVKFCKAKSIAFVAYSLSFYVSGMCGPVFAHLRFCRRIAKNEEQSIG